VRLLTDEVLEEIGNEQLDKREPAGLEFIRHLFRQAKGYDPTNKALYADIHFELPYDMFHKVDTASMLNSLEVRSPFLDYRLTERTLRIPGRLKVGIMDGKKILKRAYSQELPRAVTHRPKTGFGVPIGEWFRNDLKPMLLEVLSEKRLRKRGLFRPELVQMLMGLHFQRKKDYFWELWNLLVFEIWAENYLGDP
ncbi:MAG: asparagine synthetase B, partial [Dehalococcoidia bacterium]|nr:asparagine synthetase B [Dehalococcoidia bacterium]